MPPARTPHQHAVRRDGRCVVLLKPEILSLVDDTNAHGTIFPLDGLRILIYYLGHGNRCRSRPRLSDAVYQAVREMIVRATMPPGSRISEAELGERLGVSRTPVREALLRLADEGLVRMFPQAGI